MGAGHGRDPVDESSDKVSANGPGRRRLLHAQAMSDRDDRLPPAQWESWNPVTGCTKVSEGCRHCYAERFAERWRGIAGHHYELGFDLQLRPERLDLPLHWRRPRRVFVDSMSDLFHEGIPDDYVRAVFAVMERAHVVVGDALMEEVAHRVDEDAPRSPPVERQIEALRA